MFECTRCSHRKGALSSEPEFEFVGPKMGREGRHIKGLSDTCQVCHCLTFFVQAAAEGARGVSLFEFHGIPRPPLPPSSQHIPQRSVNPSSCSPKENVASESSDGSESNPNMDCAAAGVDLVQLMQKLTDIERRLDELEALDVEEQTSSEDAEERESEEQKKNAKVPARVREAEPGDGSAP
ncbi:uncharacterized protein LOC117897673 [Drosophila subobscura]|uniref:uncharacterized protein LOC117897673 n=1 Tax=Drosophila subobscura TaxID=7241 RepID=UPI00155A522B|nr:uncharacterized protein LOC117897673 [Drosophila subobscura]